MRVNLEQAKDSLSASLEDLEGVEDWTLISLEETLRHTVDRLSVKNGQIFWPLRAALSGLKFSPGVFEIAWALGKEESLDRISKAIEKI